MHGMCSYVMYRKVQCAMCNVRRLSACAAQCTRCTTEPQQQHYSLPLVEKCYHNANVFDQSDIVFITITMYCCLTSHALLMYIQ